MLGALVAAVVVLPLILILIFTSPQRELSPRPRSRVDQARPARTNTAENAGKQATTKSLPDDGGNIEFALIDDDGTTLWISPTSGQPIDVSYLPPGIIFVLAMRPEAIASHPEGDKIWEAGGPLEIRGLELLANDLPSIPGIAHVIIGFSVDSSGNWTVTQVVHMSKDNKRAAEYFAHQFPDAVQKTQGNQTYWLANDRAYFLPKGDDRMIVVTTPEAVIEIIGLGADPPPLRRDVERLLAHTDADRHATILFTPNSLFREGRSIFDGPATRLREPLDWFLGQELAAAALSLHWDENFYFELLAMPTLDTSPERAARILAARVAEIPDKLDAYIAQLNPHDFGREVVTRFPTMMRKLAAYTRSGFDRDHAILSGYLPLPAGHNLLMAADLTLAEPPTGEPAFPGLSLSKSAGGGAETGREIAPNSTTTTTQPLQAKLRRPTSLRFQRDTLESALEQLSQDIAVPITIRGPDLQADGITKNQSFGIDIADRPAGEVLIEILRLANPDKTATGPNDVKQKLVYVIGKSENGDEQIFVTTRAAAASRGEELPEAFRVAAR
jgi:hypothetical protein